MVAAHLVILLLCQFVHRPTSQYVHFQKCHEHLLLQLVLVADLDHIPEMKSTKIDIWQLCSSTTYTDTSRCKCTRYLFCSPTFIYTDFALHSCLHAELFLQNSNSASSAYIAINNDTVIANTYQLFAIIFPGLLIQTKIKKIGHIKARKPPWFFLKAINVNLKYRPAYKLEKVNKRHNPKQTFMES